MKVHIIRAGQDGSGTYRVDEPTRALHESYLDVQITVSEDLTVDAWREPNGRVFVKHVDLDVDVLVLQRPLKQAVHEVALVARRQGIAVVVDIDDDFHNVHRDHAAVAAIDPKVAPWHNKTWLYRTAQAADLITVSTPGLLKYAPGREHGAVIRNRIPQRALQIVGQAPQAVGWTGWLKSHPADLQQARGVLDRTDLPLRIVGDDTGVADALGLSSSRVELAAHWVKPIDAFWQAVADAFTIGVAPLQMSKFNRCKSSLKPDEYMALGIPYIASPTPEYRRVQQQSGVGVLATSNRTWAEGVITCQQRYDEWSVKARDWASTQTLEQHVHEWYDAWVEAKRVYDMSDR